MTQAQEMGELEVDGDWYHATGATDLKSSWFPPGRQYNDIVISLVTNWQTKDGRHLRLTPARHAVRFALIATPTDRAQGNSPIRAVSNPVQIVIAPGIGGRADRALEKPQSDWGGATNGPHTLMVSERIQRLIQGAPVTTNRVAEIWERTAGPAGEYRVRPEVTQSATFNTDDSKLLSCVILHLPARNRFYIQWEDLASPGTRYYGPFEGDPFRVLGSAASAPAPAPVASQPRQGQLTDSKRVDADNPLGLDDETIIRFFKTGKALQESPCRLASLPRPWRPGCPGRLRSRICIKVISTGKNWERTPLAMATCGWSFQRPMARRWFVCSAWGRTACGTAASQFLDRTCAATSAWKLRRARARSAGWPRAPSLTT